MRAEGFSIQGRYICLSCSFRLTVKDDFVRWGHVLDPLERH